MNIRAIFLFFFLLINITSVFAQDDEKACGKTTNKKALSILDNAKKETDWNRCKEIVDEAISEEAEFPEAYFFLAQRAKRKMEYATAIEAYKKLIEICPNYSDKPYFDLATYYFDKKNYDESIKYFKAFRKLDKVKDDDVRYADSLVRVAKLLKNPVPFEPKPVAGICTDKNEYLPIISADNEMAFYTRAFEKLKRGDLVPSMVEEFTYSVLDSATKQFSSGELMPPPFNMSYNEGGASITIDNNHLYFTICKDGSGYVNCDIYYSDKRDGKWDTIRNMGPNVNSPKSWDSQPCISRDGSTLYFASDRNQEMGADIYFTKKGADGKWEVAAPLGGNINTKGNEKSPFLHPDDRTLYFSSDALSGMGGFDIYMAKKDSTKKWGTPKNLGFPINSENDELGFFVSTDGNTGYFASNKLKGKGGWDVYFFPLYEGARPERVLFVKGGVDKKDMDTTIAMTKVELKNTKTKEVLKLDVDSATGKYVGVVNFDNDYILTMKREGYGFESNYFSSADTTLKEIAKVEMPMVAIEVGSTFTLKNINYKTNSADLQEESKIVVEEFIQFLAENPKVKVEIRGHTDNVGEDKANLALSTDRAFTVYERAVELGIPQSKISFKGFGKTKPVASNDTETGRAKNRRTEFVILEK